MSGCFQPGQAKVMPGPTPLVLIDWQWPLSAVHSTMIVSSAQLGAGGGCSPSPFHSFYHHKQSCGVRSSWEGRLHSYFSSTLFSAVGPTLAKNYLLSGKLLYHHLLVPFRTLSTPIHVGRGSSVSLTIEGILKETHAHVTFAGTGIIPRSTHPVNILSTCHRKIRKSE